MATLFAKRKSPPTVPTDTVIPLHYFDDQPHWRSLVLHFTYRFDDVLDPEKLRATLARLLAMEGWRKLGARLRLNADGKLEYHIPASYDEHRPAFSYACVDEGISIVDHKLASQLPRGGAEPALYRDAADFKPLVLQEDTPRRLDDWLYSDIPQLSVSVVRFADATLLTLTWPHTLFDAVGRASLLQAWTAVLSGKEDEVPEFIGYDRDPLEALDGKMPPEKHLLYDKLLTGWSFALFVIYTILETLFYRKDEARTIFLPGSFVKQMRQEALQSLAVTDSADAEKPFVSDGDVLLAWYARTIVEALNPSPSNSVMLMNVINFRGTIDDIVGPYQAFLGNATTTSNTELSARQLLNQPLGTTAMAVRRSLLEQKSREQFEAYVSLHKQKTKQKGAVVFGSSDMIMIPFSNWTRAKFFDFDFSTAVTKPGIPLQQRSNKLGRASFINIAGDNNGITIRNGGPCIGKDAGGDWWLTMTLRSGAWKTIEEHFQAGLKAPVCGHEPLRHTTSHDR